MRLAMDEDQQGICQHQKVTGLSLVVFFSSRISFSLHSSWSSYIERYLQSGFASGWGRRS